MLTAARVIPAIPIVRARVIACLLDLSRHITRQIIFAEGKHEEHVWIGNRSARGIARKFEWIGDSSEKAVVIGDEQSVPGVSIDDYILPKRRTFDLGWNQITVNAGGIEAGDGDYC